MAAVGVLIGLAGGVIAMKTVAAEDLVVGAVNINRDDMYK